MATESANSSNDTSAVTPEPKDFFLFGFGR